MNVECLLSFNFMLCEYSLILLLTWKSHFLINVINIKKLSFSYLLKVRFIGIKNIVR